MFVDEYTEEYSRDIEPMHGGHGDNYYYQMISFIRRFKGTRSIPAAGPAQSIIIDGDFKDWQNVTPEYCDDTGDTALMRAASQNNLEALKTLIDAEAKVDMKNKRGQTALMFSAAEGHVNIVRALV